MFKSLKCGLFPKTLSFSLLILENKSDSFQVTISGHVPDAAGVHPQPTDLPGHSEGWQAGGDQQLAWPG